jgi:prolycopene isomerase
VPAPTSDAYDAIVVGGGLGGLSAGACLARSGRHVLLVERQDGVGGNAHAFTRGAYTFDPAIHVTAHGYNIEFFDFYFAALGVSDKIELIPAETLMAVDICGERFHLPIGTQALVDALEEYFPGAGAGAFIGVAAEATRESQQPPPRVALRDLEEAMKALPTLFKYRTATLREVLDEHVTDERAKAVCAGQWPYMGVPPSRCSFMAYTGAFMAFCDPGPQYVRGSFQHLADTIASAITDSGGEVLTETEATRIVVEDGKVTGVELMGEQVVRAPIVVSNADARLTFDRLIGEERVPERYLKKLRRMKPSISGFLLYSAAKIDPASYGLEHETMVYRHWDHEETWRDVLAGRPGGTWLSVPTMHDPALAPEGEHIVIYTSLMPYDIGEPWEQARERITEQMIDQVEELMPGYREAVTFVDSANPKTFEGYTLAQEGAIYGWENVPTQTVPKRLDFRTPIEGLWLSGHWTHPGTGSVRCLLSGAQTAAAITGVPDPRELLGRLAGAAEPPGG